MFGDESSDGGDNFIQSDDDSEFDDVNDVVEVTKMITLWMA